jgi:hypothetical protein
MDIGVTKKKAIIDGFDKTIMCLKFSDVLRGEFMTTEIYNRAYLFLRIPIQKAIAQVPWF